MPKYPFKVNIEVFVSADNPSKARLVADRLGRQVKDVIEGKASEPIGKTGHSEFLGEWGIETGNVKTMRPTGKRSEKPPKVKEDQRQQILV